MATPLDDEGVFKTPAPPPLRKASTSLSSFSMIQKAGPSLLQPVGSPLSLGLSGPNTPQSELSDCSYLQLQGVPENSRYFCTASAVDVNVAYQVCIVNAKLESFLQYGWNLSSCWFSYCFYWKPRLFFAHINFNKRRKISSNFGKYQWAVWKKNH